MLKKLIAMTACISSIIIITGCGVDKETNDIEEEMVINLTEYIKVSCEGENGEGTATAKLNTRAIDNNYGMSGILTKDTDESLGSVIDSLISIEADPAEHLSNNETIHITITVDEEKASEYMTCTVIGGTVDYTVASLSWKR